ncbi:MAG: peptidyl-prolyl cis-trans isomerase [Candidatus Marinimicrobia bacterium]|nr:peptidyl-prolyl cis-trans isomerase [Candidatus Neomarinimicrobiota bacterium]
MAKKLGNIIIKLNAEKAPKTVENFINYCDEEFYKGTIFHRVIKGFMIQGGGFSKDMNKKATKLPVENEAFNGLKNMRGTIAMARTQDPHSATAQFFINTVDNPSLNYQNKTLHGWGYCVFGLVTEGMHVVDEIENAKTSFHGMYQDVPEQDYFIDSVVVDKNEVTFGISVE